MSLTASPLADAPYAATIHAVVDVGRPDAARLAAAILEATEDPFHHRRVRELRAAEAAQLLSALEDVDYALANLRSHALGDLCKRVVIEPDG